MSPMYSRPDEMIIIDDDTEDEDRDLAQGKANFHHDRHRCCLGTNVALRVPLNPTRSSTSEILVYSAPHFSLVLHK